MERSEKADASSISHAPEGRPGLEVCCLGDSGGLANVRSGRALARLVRLIDGRAALPLRDDPEGERQLASMCATCARLLLRGEDFLPRPFSRPGTTREASCVWKWRG